MAKTVTVACRLPHGLVLQLQRQTSRPEPVMGGGSRDVPVWEKVGDTITLNGWSHAVDRAAPNLIMNGYALTYNVDADFMDKWMEQNADHPAVKSGNIMVMTRAGDIKARTQDHVGERVGFEPHVPKNPIPEFKRRVETAAA